MTTAAWDGVTLAVDRQMTSGGVKSVGTKIVFNKKWAFAMVGPVHASVRFWDALIHDNEPHSLGEGVHGVLVNRETKLAYTIEGPYGVLIAGESGWLAAGSGADFAAAAMYLGKDARTAVRVASQFDAYTGMGVRSIKP